MKFNLFFSLLIFSLSAFSQQDTTKRDIELETRITPPPPLAKNSSPEKVKEEIQYDSNHCIIGAHQAYPQKYNIRYFSKYSKEIEDYVQERMSPSDTLEGTVMITFKVDTLGVVSEIKIVHGLNPKIDSLAIEGLKNLGDCCPAYQLHKRIAMRMTVVIKLTYKNYYLKEEETD